MPPDLPSLFRRRLIRWRSEVDSSTTRCLMGRVLGTLTCRAKRLSRTLFDGFGTSSLLTRTATRFASHRPIPDFGGRSENSQRLTRVTFRRCSRHRRTPDRPTPKSAERLRRSAGSSPLVVSGAASLGAGRPFERLEPGLGRRICGSRTAPRSHSALGTSLGCRGWGEEGGSAPSFRRPGRAPAHWDVALAGGADAGGQRRKRQLAETRRGPRPPSCDRGPRPSAAPSHCGSATDVASPRGCASLVPCRPQSSFRGPCSLLPRVSGGVRPIGGPGRGRVLLPPMAGLGRPPASRQGSRRCGSLRLV